MQLSDLETVPDAPADPHGILGHHVLYRVNAWEAEILNDLREAHQAHARTSPGAIQRGYVARVGNIVYAGQCYPATVVRDFGDGRVNLQVFLDGQDTHWACSAHQSPDDDRVWEQVTSPELLEAPETADVEMDAELEQEDADPSTSPHADAAPTPDASAPQIGEGSPSPAPDPSPDE